MSINPRIFGAFIVGSGLIGLSYFGAHQSAATASPNPVDGVVAGPAPERSYIEVADKNNNGVPDWRENIRDVKVVPFEVDTDTATYTPPTTLTGKLAIELFQRTVNAEIHAPFGDSQEVILDSAAEQIAAAATDKLYTIADLTLSGDNSLDALKAYGNKVAEIAIVNGVPGNTENEAVITKKAMDAASRQGLEPLQLIATSYQNMSEQMLALPVPRALAREHSDLINAYHALAIDVKAMQAAFDDPLYTMTRLKRYQDDSNGLYYGILNVYTKLAQNGVTYETDDLAPQVFHFFDIW